MRPAFTSIILLLLALPGPGALQAQDDTVIFLVRHAERADDAVPTDSVRAEKPTMATGSRMMATDPPLSMVGRERAALLATLLRDADITNIHSTDVLRTRETAQPIAETTGLEISLYDASDLAAFAEELLSTPGTHLVVGHSDTTPELVTALGGNPGPPIELMEYDRLYMVIPGQESTRTILLRFGEAFLGNGVVEG
ncbi:MAG: histidine phosphatase family protein [Gemmatimonadota bacterium]|jgi:phosphohistidine phosphatase SixA